MIPNSRRPATAPHVERDSCSLVLFAEELGLGLGLGLGCMRCLFTVYPYVVNLPALLVGAGAIYQSASNLTISGHTTFEDNTAATGGKKAGLHHVSVLPGTIVLVNVKVGRHHNEFQVHLYQRSNLSY